MKRFGAVSTAFASGWMRIRGTRRRQSIDRGFVLSDHADWPGLLQAIRATGAECVWSRTAIARRGPLAARTGQASARARNPLRRREREDVDETLDGAETRMKAFADLYTALDETTKTNEKVEALPRYFARRAAGRRGLGDPLPDRPPPQAPDRNAQAGASGRSTKRASPTGSSASATQAVGDLAETIALLLPPPARSTDQPLHYWVEERLLPLREWDDEQRSANRWSRLARDGRARSASSGTS